MKTDVTLGIDIGGTNTKFGLVDVNGNCFAESFIETKSNQNADLFFRRLADAANDLFISIREKVTLKGIGIGAPNANYFKGTIENPPNLNWGFVNAVQIVKKFYDLPVAITNDANASAIGEMLFGAAKGMTDFIVITLGTGLGSGIVVNGKLVYGSDGFAGEIGHTIYDPNGRLCGCGRKGCLETYVSAKGIKRTVIEMMETSDLESSLRNISTEELDSKMIYSEAIKGDKLANDAFIYTSKILGVKLADAVAITSPEAIILFGGLSQAGDLLLNPTKTSMEENLFHVFKNKVRLITSELNKGNAAVLGASALIWNEILN